MPESIVGKVQTVQGPIDPSEVGVTLTHEHLLINFLCVLQEMPGAGNRGRMNEPVSIENLWWVRHYWNSNIDNLQLTDIELTTREAKGILRRGRFHHR